MTNYNLDLTLVTPLSKNKPKQAIILCHGYGGDGKDISTLAINWRRFLPDAIFLCPNAPEVCADNPRGYQWFDMTSENEEMIFEKSLAAAEKLNIVDNEKETSVQEVIKSDFAEPGEEDVFRKIQSDFKKASVSISDSEIREKMSSFLERVKKELL